MTDQSPNARPTISWRVLKRSLLLFWAVWLSLVVATNVTDGLKALDVLPASFRFVSGNYKAILEVVAPLDLPVILAGWLFAGVVVWESVSMLLFWWAGLTFQGVKEIGSRRRLVVAFTVGLGLWATFQIACEALPSPLAYQIEGTHRGLFTAQLATLLAIVLLPDE